MADFTTQKPGNTPGFYADFADYASLRGKSAQDPDGAIREVAEQFESLFISQLLKAMRDTLPKDGLLGSPDLATYQQMMDQQLALNLSSNGGIGLADLIEQQLRPAVPSGQRDTLLNDLSPVSPPPTGTPDP